MTKTQERPSTPLPWQPEKMLHAGDRIVILTDVQILWSKYFDFSPEQELFRVGGFDARSGCIGFFKFGRDLAFDMIMGGVPVAPWGAGVLPIGIEIHRRSHGNNSQGRFRGKVSLLDVAPDVLAIVPEARRRLRQEGHAPNATVGMWSDLEERAKSELAIDAAVVAMVGEFKASDVRKIVGDDKRISRVLRDLVRDGRLTPVSAKKYVVTPPKLVTRLDWTG